MTNDRKSKRRHRIASTMAINSAVAMTDSASLAPPNHASVNNAIAERAGSSTAPNEASIKAIRALMDEEPVLANKWGSKGDDSTLNLTADTLQFDENGNVVFLNLGGMRLRSLPSNVFESLTHLETLNLGGTDLPLSQLESVLKSLQNVESLLLGGNSLGPEGADMVAWAVKDKTSIKHLDLRYNDIGDQGISAISDAIADLPIKYLYLEGNKISSTGCGVLSVMLTGNSTIEELYLGANDIGTEGAKSLAEVITINKTLRKLYIDGNQMGPQGAIVLAEALESLDGKATLTELYADNNNLGKEAAKRLAKALNSNTAIEDSLFE